jgi:hypothetical protein
MTVRILLCISLVSLAFSGCGSPSTQLSGSGAQAITISPSSAVAGSSTFELTITGQNFAGQGLCPSCLNSVVVWTDSSTDRLATTFVSSTQLQADVPADLLTSAATAKVTVETWAEGANGPQSVTKPAIFSVTALAAGAPTLSAISPAYVSVGSTDVTITITGSNFENYKSVAFWTTAPNNLHDHGTMLNTTFVSSTQITAVIPASLLANQGSAQIVVLTGDPMGMSDGFFGYPESNALTFTVTQ